MIAAGSAQSQAVFWGGVLIFAFVGLGAVIWAIRKRLFTETPRESGEVWSLQHLRDLRAGGQISEEEFKILRANLLKSARGAGGGADANVSESRKGGAAGE